MACNASDTLRDERHMVELSGMASECGSIDPRYGNPPRHDHITAAENWLGHFVRMASPLS